MKASVDIDTGICGFRTQVTASSDDAQYVTLEIETDCDKTRQLADRLAAAGPIDAFQEISPVNDGVIMQAVRATLRGCCAGCAAPVGIFKAMQVAAGLALPKDVIIRMTKE